jgi:HAD superfamily hydrolase (TIGR01484 family)
VGNTNNPVILRLVQLFIIIKRSGVQELGKFFETEIESLSSTLKFAFSDTVSEPLQTIVDSVSTHNMLVVGSGGSLSAAHFIAQVHEEMTGHMAKPVTPLEIVSSSINPSENGVLFLTASGNNKDILNAFEVAARREFATIGIVCASQGSKIAEKAKAFSSNTNCFEYTSPAGKDGFLAVNSLLATCILVGRGYRAIESSHEPFTNQLLAMKREISGEQLEEVLRRRTFVAIGSKWSWPAVIDLESKFTEAALGVVLTSDLRNFGHGRHFWFAKRGKESALVVLDTPETSELTERTLSLLPEEYPRLILRSPLTGPSATIDLLIRVFHLVNMAGKHHLIDPGRPGVPEFGRKIFHISLPRSSRVDKPKNRRVWLDRKSRVCEESHSILTVYLDKFLTRLAMGRFDGVVFDYDGTLCDPCERFSQPRKEISTFLNDLLGHGIPVGIATGRGGSVQVGLRRIIAPQWFGNCLVGNYNGALIQPLNVDIPESYGTCIDTLQNALEIIENDSLFRENCIIKQWLKQISIVPKQNSIRATISRRLEEVLWCLHEVKIVESDHSIDILDSSVSKHKVIDSIAQLSTNEDAQILVIGDQGQYGGNDFEMLNTPYSLSVNKISTSIHNCWNLSPAGSRGVGATISITKALEIDRKSKTLRLDIKTLESEAKK